MNEPQQTTQLTSPDASEPLQTDLDTEGQAVESQAEQGGEPENNADTSGSSLDKHLEQFEQANQAAESASKGGLPSAEAEEASSETQESVDNSPPDSRIDALWERYEQDAMQEANKAFDDAVTRIKESSPLLAGAPDYMVRGALQEMNRQDPRIGNAFANRNVDSGLWDKTVVELGKQIVSDMSVSPDSASTDAQAAVRASVNSQSSASSTGVSDEEISNMSDSEFAQYKADNGLI